MADWKKKRQQEAARRETKRQRKIRQRKKQAGKPGYDKYGTKTVAERKREEATKPGAAAGPKKLPGINVPGRTPVKPSAPKQGPQPAPERQKTAGAGKIKAKGIKSTPVSKIKTTSPKIKPAPRVEKKKLSWNEQKDINKSKKKFDKASELKKRADAAGKGGNFKKAARLERRAKRQTERGAGTRKSTAGSILKGAGLALGRGLARVGGYGGKFKGKGSDKKFKL